jgi:hypothetical protein
MDEEHPREFDSRRVLPLASGVLPVRLVRSDSVVPIDLDADGRLTLGVLESCTDETLDKVRFVCNRELKVVVVSKEAMAYAIERYALVTEPD